MSFKENPFTLSFGKKPQEYIDRIEQKNQITDTFNMTVPSSQIFMIAGIRGSGKTVLLSDISSYYQKKNDWIVLNLIPNMDIVGTAVSEIRSSSRLKSFFSSIDFSVQAMGANISFRDQQTANNVIILRQMLSKLKEKNKKVLFLIDEVVNNDFIQTFSSIFQVYLRENLPVYLVMTGLYDNISNLQNEKSLTFLYRAPKIFLQPLSMPVIAGRYKNVFDCDQEKAVKMAKDTKGYPFAFQILGYLCWTHKTLSEEIYEEYDQYLAMYAYEKIWSELSEMDKKVVETIAQGTTKIKDIRTQLNISPQLLNVYRVRLKQQGLVNGDTRGQLTLTLPRFEQFIRLYNAF